MSSAAHGCAPLLTVFDWGHAGTGPSGSLLLSCGYDGKICCWDAIEVFAPITADEAASQAASQADTPELDVANLLASDIEPLCQFEVLPGQVAVEALFCAIDLDAVASRGKMKAGEGGGYLCVCLCAMCIA